MSQDHAEFASGSDVELAQLLRESGFRKKTVDVEHSAVVTHADPTYKHRYSGANEPLPPLPSYMYEVHAGGVKSDKRNRWKYSRLKSNNHTENPHRGWRKTLTAASITTGIVFLINLVFAIVVMMTCSVEDAVGTIYKGDCTVVSRWDTGLHLVINALGTLLLGASNFTMQCLSSPTRSEVDAVHQWRKSLTIGIPNAGNLRHMHWWKGALWILLGLSSLPLHMLWNSTIFSTRAANLFDYLVVDASFLEGASYLEPWTDCSFAGVERTTCAELSTKIRSILAGYDAKNYTDMTAAQCLDSYTVNYLTAHRNLILVAAIQEGETMGYLGYGEAPWTNSSVINIGVNQSILNFIIDELYAQKQQAKVNGTWNLYDDSGLSFKNYTVERCLSQTKDVAAQCELQFVPVILYVVLISNFVKLACMCAAVNYLWNLKEPILATVGDAVASYLEQSDMTTVGRCLVDFETHKKSAQDSFRVYNRKRETRIYRGTSHARWWCSMLPLILLQTLAWTWCWLYIVKLLSYGRGSFNQVMKNFGKVDNQSRLTIGLAGRSGSGLIIDIIMANTVQLAVSATYFLYNSLYTAQYAALEWTTFITGARKALRVTYPRGQQRSTFYLQLPYYYSVPLLVAAIVMHFLASETVFLARLQYYDSNGAPRNDLGWMNVGLSLSGLLSSCCVGTALILIQIFHAWLPLIDNRIPIHGNSSVVISAMCHPPTEHEREHHSIDNNELGKLATRPLMWGVTRQPELRSDGNETLLLPGHCGFTADVVELPIIGSSYS